MRKILLRIDNKMLKKKNLRDIQDVNVIIGGRDRGKG